MIDRVYCEARWACVIWGTGPCKKSLLYYYDHRRCRRRHHHHHYLFLNYVRLLFY